MVRRFSCAVDVNVNPATDVKTVQAEVTTLLSLTFSHNFLTITVFTSSIVILPVEVLPRTTEPPTTNSTNLFPPKTTPADASTTKKPDLTLAVVDSDQFFRVNLTLSMTGSPASPSIVIERWLKEELQVNRTMIVLNVIIKENVDSKLDIETDTTHWADPDMTNCHQLLTISDLINITVTPGNAAEVVDMIQELVDVQLGNSSQLSHSELGSVVEKLSEVVDVSPIEPDIGGDIVNIVANILLSETDVTPVANSVLDLTDRMGNSMEFQGEIANIKAPALALSMIDVDPDEFSGLTFGVSLTATMNPEVFVNQSFVNKPFPETNATISLPPELNHFLPTGEKNTTRVQFQFYGTPDLFQDSFIVNATQRNWTLNSCIVSASINNSQVINLEKRVVVTLNHANPKQPEDKVQCMFWDFQKYGCITDFYQ
ncbi:adhesion G-protein coupled receptor G2 [Nematolebias whitei]|uniref:adhesion G-protein coupled receptor G2 n=1 Tax=Nematolebias whitei TaxID=451745 RepID=UPI0018992E2B|nr:adhesion G-protein coupled receptor G2 [Nematolebias whitei]